MPRKAFNDRWLKTVKTEKLKEEFIDSSFNERGSFGVIISRTGTKRFFHRYRVDGQKRRDILGTYPSLSLAEARERAIDNVSRLNKGSDPSSVKREYRKAEKFSELAELFFERSKDRLAKETLKNYRKMYERDLEPAWARRKAIEITKADVIQVPEHICYERNAPIKSNRTYELISRIFNFGISRDIVQLNPVRGLEKLGRSGKESGFYLRMRLNSSGKPLRNRSRTFVQYFACFFLPGNGRGEIKSLQWAHIDRDILTIPSENSKNRRKHQIHLTPLALEELEFVKNTSGGRQFAFSVGSNTEPIEFLNKGQLAIAATMEKLLQNGSASKRKNRDEPKAIPHWTPRDIRRTVQTRMAEMGIRPDVVDRVLNHNVAGVRKHYDHYSYYPEIRKALIRWNQRLAEIVSGKGATKVVSIR